MKKSKVDFIVPIKDGEYNSKYNSNLANYTNIQSRISIKSASHLHRSHGEIKSKYSLVPVVAELQILLPNFRVRFFHHCIRPDIEEIYQSYGKGNVILLESLQFHPEEERLTLCNTNSRYSPNFLQQKRWAASSWVA